MNEIHVSPFPKGNGWTETGFYVGSDNVMTAEQAIQVANLDWQVEEEALYTHEGVIISGGQAVPKHREITTHKAIVRADSRQVMGVVGKKYTPIQNHQAFSFMDKLVEEGLMKYHSAGKFRDGRRIWLLGKVGEVEVLSGDTVDQFLLLFNSHDGSTSLSAVLTSIRLACMNALVGLLRKRTRQGRGVMLRHTTNIWERFGDSHAILETAIEDFEQSAVVMKEAARTRLSNEQWANITKQIFKDPPEDKKHLLPRVEQRREDLTELFHNGVGQDIPGVQNTVWAGINAITEYANFHKVVRGANKDERRLESALFGLNAKWVDKNVSQLMAA